MIRKGDAQGGQPWATNGTGETRARAAAHVSTRHDTATCGTRQELARLGSQAGHIARRCPEPRQRARFTKIARFLLRAARGGRQHGR